jgi:hypothetical protein
VKKEQNGRKSLRRLKHTVGCNASKKRRIVSTLDRKTNEYIRGKMDAQDMTLDDITRKQLIWYGHVERMDPTRLPKIIIHCKPERRKKQGRPRRTWKDGIYTAMNERDLRMGEWNNRRQWNRKSEGVVRILTLSDPTSNLV